MRVAYFKSTIGGSPVATPLSCEELRAATMESDLYSSSRSPIDPDESDFLHVRSSWFGVRLNAGVTPRTDKLLPISLDDRTDGAAVLSADGAMSITSHSGAAFDKVYVKVTSAIATIADSYLRGISMTSGYAVAKNVWIAKQNAQFFMCRSITLFDIAKNVFIRADNIPYTGAGYTYTQDEAADLYLAEIALSVDESMEKYLPTYGPTKFVWSAATIATKVVYGSFFGTVVPPRHFPCGIDPQLERVTRGDLSRTCVDAVKVYQTDPISNAVQLPELATLSQSLPRRKSDLLNPKFWAGAYLAYKYGVETTVRDAKELHRGISAYMDQKTDSGIGSTRAVTKVSSKNEYKRHPGTHVLRCKLKFFTQDSGIASDLLKLYKLGLMPTIGTAWDLVPFSFILDWFIHVDNVISAIDYDPIYSTLHVKSVTYSRTTSVTQRIPPETGVVLPSFGTTVHYSRAVFSQAFDPIPRFKVSSLSLNNTIAGIALIVGGKK